MTGSESSAEARRRQMADHLLGAGSATPGELAERFDISVVTVHRDLAELERRGVVRKFHGGVTALPSSTFESLLAHRLKSHVMHKQAIARTAAGLVEPGMSIMLDDSTTVLQLVRYLPEHTPLTVVTNFVRGLGDLISLQATDLTVIGIGGRYDPAHDSYTGLQAEEQVRGMRVDAAFVSTSAVSRTALYYQGDAVASLKRAMIESSARTYLLVDHSKLQRDALLRVAPVTDVDVIVTDSEADQDHVDAWRRAGVDCRIAPPDGARATSDPIPSNPREGRP